MKRIIGKRAFWTLALLSLATLVLPAFQLQPLRADGSAVKLPVADTRRTVSAETILECPGKGRGGDRADRRGIRFTVDRSFSQVDVGMDGSSAGVYEIDAELRRSIGFLGTADFTASGISVTVPGTPSETPYQPVQIDFGNVPVSGTQTFTLKFIVKSGPDELFFETFGRGYVPCDNVEETEENDVANPTVRSDPAGFRVSSTTICGDENSELALDLECGTAAEPSFTPHQDLSDGATGFKVDISRVFDPTTGNDVAVPLAEFRIRLTYDATCINITGFREMDFNIDDTTIDNSGGAATFNGTAPAGVTAPAGLGLVLTELLGSALQSCPLTLEITSLDDLDGNKVDLPSTLTQNVRRGDAGSDGNVTIADALLLAQNLLDPSESCIGSEGAICLQPVNAAGVRHDGAFDKNTVADALFVAQYLAGLRNEFYGLVPRAPRVRARYPTGQNPGIIWSPGPVIR